MARSRSESAQLSFTFLPILTPQGDGSFVVKPGKPVTTLTVRETAQQLHVHISSVYRLIDEGVLACERPLRGKILVPSSAIEEHRRNSRNPEFWDKTR